MVQILDVFEFSFRRKKMKNIKLFENDANQMKCVRLFSFTDITNESVEVLRERLSAMKRLIADKQAADGAKGKSIDDILFNKPTKNAGIIDANFLSFALCGALCVILVVAVYAFYSLYHAVLKKFPSHHTEL